MPLILGGLFKISLKQNIKKEKGNYEKKSKLYYWIEEKQKETLTYTCLKLLELTETIMWEL